MSLEAVRPAESVADRLTLRRLGEYRFRGRTHGGPSRRSYGGEVAGQAVLAAGHTAPADRPIHSAQTYFLLPGDTTVPTEFVVEPVRDGGSFSTRRVEALQNDRVIFTMLASFHRTEEGLQHQVATLDAPGPDELPDIASAFAGYPEALKWTSTFLDALGIEARFPEPPARAQAMRGEVSPARQRVWLRTRAPLPDGRLEQAACLMYLSDLLLLSATIGPHGEELGDHGLQVATVNHSIWFHAPLRADDWFLHDQYGRWAGGGRGLAHGEILDRSGRLCATTMQEGLIRRR
ncbi:acyl-CoA thioesterase II [Nocardia speluncae]|uniref:Acyl-CoA thioesterase II n=1 Tax=Nocardia speluncae TaxID=419477 RepID=A0A846XAS6_9NOCA|nr:acyl-CoA thioesterase domain-containing protein [Nocardia speluncae]NKY31753.1 acyl-CoA thioesterase II [Nocardia speluncae]